MSYKSGLAALCAITSLLIVATGCGGNADDEDAPAAPPAPATSNTSTPYDGIYETRLTPATARKIPDPAFTAGTYRLVLGEGKYAIHGDRGPYGGPLTASSGRLRFGANRYAGCTATASYTATLRAAHFGYARSTTDARARVPSWSADGAGDNTRRPSRIPSPRGTPGGARCGDPHPTDVLVK